MNKNFSIYLDALRFLAALLVCVSHWAYPRFTDGDFMIVRELNLGSDAVIFFFVLSGFVIAYTSDVKDKTLKKYAWHRATRLYSVVILALILTIVFDTLGAPNSAENYAAQWYNPAPLWQQLAYGLSFTNEWVFSDGFRVGSNGPYWSLSYEVLYYLLFAAAFYLRGGLRIALIILLGALGGINILLLFPTWLMGASLYYKLRKLNPPAPSMPLLHAFLPVLLYVIFLNLQLPKQLLVFTVDTIGIEAVRNLRFSGEFIWNTLIGLLITWHLWAVFTLCNSAKKPCPEKLKNIIRWGAGGSFTLYILHYPALQYIDTLLPGDLPLRHAALLLCVLGICLLAAEVSERRLNSLRKLFV